MEGEKKALDPLRRICHTRDEEEGIEESWRHRSPRDPVAVGRVRLRRDTRERYEKLGEVEEPS